MGIIIRAAFICLILLSMKIIDLSGLQIAAVMSIGLICMVMRFRRPVIAATFLAFCWSVLVLLGFLPTFPVVSAFLLQNADHAKIIEQTANLKMKRAEAGSDSSARESHITLNGYDEQIHAIDVLAKSGDIQREDAARMKESIARKNRKPASESECRE